MMPSIQTTSLLDPTTSSIIDNRGAKTFARMAVVKASHGGDLIHNYSERMAAKNMLTGQRLSNGHILNQHDVEELLEPYYD